ncbi:MAG: DNA-binding protein [Thermoplasmata archaeon]|nr:DNA-binding protein [Thermoplasmata archaeon]
MQSARKGHMVVAKLSKGENLLAALREIIEKHDIVSGLVISGIGMLKNVELGYYSGEKHEPKRFEGPRELIALHGSMTTGGETVIHLHCALSDEKYEVVGGHLIDAEVAVVAELVIAKLSKIELGRELNPETGLKELSVG